ncbi:thiamine biosynthesis protein [Thiovibrio sp. JS02]
MTVALALFSGGLDSILACRLVAAQGIRVKAVKFVTPFFGYDLLGREAEHVEWVRETYGIELLLRDVSDSYLAMLANPPHGYGKNFNPCIDCKILLMKAAREMMDECAASFLISGEVLGQRPMSQRQDTLRLIARESGCEDLILRPLCAKTQEPTPAELVGLVDRERLLAFRGRGRQPQMRLAKSFGISEYPMPAGGCVLTEQAQAKRIAWYYGKKWPVNVSDIRLLLFGRHFQLPHGGWLALGRDQAENERIAALHQGRGDLLTMEERPGPLGLLRYSEHPEDLAAAAGLVVRYGKKVEQGSPAATVVLASAGRQQRLVAGPLEDAVFQAWYL